MTFLGRVDQTASRWEESEPTVRSMIMPASIFQAAVSLSILWGWPKFAAFLFRFARGRLQNSGADLGAGASGGGGGSCRVFAFLDVESAKRVFHNRKCNGFKSKTNWALWILRDYWSVIESKTGGAASSSSTGPSLPVPWALSGSVYRVFLLEKTCFVLMGVKVCFPFF